MRPPRMTSTCSDCSTSAAWMRLWYGLLGYPSSIFIRNLTSLCSCSPHLSTISQRLNSANDSMDSGRPLDTSFSLNASNCQSSTLASTPTTSSGMFLDSAMRLRTLSCVTGCVLIRRCGSASSTCCAGSSSILAGRLLLSSWISDCDTSLSSTVWLFFISCSLKLTGCRKSPACRMASRRSMASRALTSCPRMILSSSLSVLSAGVSMSIAGLCTGSRCASASSSCASSLWFCFLNCSSNALTWEMFCSHTSTAF
mmetsp:Transcript_17852/g.45037  ORF Transcript_17852/g.45037 Transcript_17852/m.45037 type:complete len:255 (-) Transcript_17852:1108-1872(-)